MTYTNTFVNRSCCMTNCGGRCGICPPPTPEPTTREILLHAFELCHHQCEIEQPTNRRERAIVRFVDWCARAAIRRLSRGA